MRAGDVAAAQAAYAPSRVSWERIEPIAGLVADIDGAVDARVDDFEGPDDPTWTGWHRLEYLLWEQNTTEGGAEFADKLDADLATLQSQVARARAAGRRARGGCGRADRGGVGGQDHR